MKKIIQRVAFLFSGLLVANFAEAQCPSLTISPVSQTLTCNGAPATFTAIFSPTANVSAAWYGAGNTLINVSGTSPLVMSTSNPGTYTFIATNNTNSCSTTQTLAVAGVTMVPTMTINCLSGNTISCNNPCLPFNISATSGPAPKTYSWTNVTTSVTATPATGGYTICTPGKYIAEYQDGWACRISQTITVLIDTLRPNPMAYTNLPANSFTLNCYNPNLVATGYSNPLLPASNYSWTAPPNLTIASNTLSINTTNVPSSPTTFTVLAKGTNGCVGRAPILIYKNVIAPSVTVSPTSKTITCNGAPATFTANFSPSVTATGLWYAETSAPITAPLSTGAVTMSASSPGTYSFTTIYSITGCSITQTVSVAANTVVPTMTITSSNGFAITCLNPCVFLQTTGSLGPAPKTFTWTNLTTSVTTMPVTGNCTACSPGSYLAEYQDGNMCRVSQMVYVNNNTVAPTILASSSSSLICVGQSVVLTANGASTYTWNTGATTSAIAVSPTVNTTYTVSGTNSSSGCNGSTVITQSVSLCMNVAELSLQNNYMEVFPNPSNGEFTLRANVDVKCSIINELGQVVKTVELSEVNDHAVMISDLPSGIYFIVGQNGDQILNKKIIIAK